MHPVLPLDSSVKNAQKHNGPIYSGNISENLRASAFPIIQPLPLHAGQRDALDEVALRHEE